MAYNYLKASGESPTNDEMWYLEMSKYHDTRYRKTQ